MAKGSFKPGPRYSKPLEHSAEYLLHHVRSTRHSISADNKRISRGYNGPNLCARTLSPRKPLLNHLTSSSSSLTNPSATVTSSSLNSQPLTNTSEYVLWRKALSSSRGGIMKEVMENNMCVKKFYAPLREVKNVIDGEHHNWLSTFFKRLGRENKESVTYLEEIKNLKFRNEKLQTQLVFTASRSFSELKEAAKMVENNHQELVNTHQELKKTHQELENTHQELEKIKAQLETANITSTNSTSQVQSLQQQLQEAKQAFQTNQQLCSSKDAEISEPTSKLAGAENTRTALSESKAEIERLRAELEGVQNGKHQMEWSKNSEIQSLQNQLSTAGDANQQLTRSRSDVAELQHQLKQASAEKHKLQQSANSELSRLDSQLTSASNLNDQLNNSVSSLRRQIQNMQVEQAEDQKGRHDIGDIQLELAWKELNEANNKLAKAATAKSDWHRKFLYANQELKGLRRHRARIEDLERQVRKWSQACAAKDKELQQIKADNGVNDITALFGDTAVGSAVSVDSNKQVEELKQAIQDKDDTIKRLNAQVEELGGKVEEAEADLREYSKRQADKEREQIHLDAARRRARKALNTAAPGHNTTRADEFQEAREDELEDVDRDGDLVIDSVEADLDTAPAEGMDTDAPPAGSHPVTSMEDVDSPLPRSSMALSPSPPPR